MKTMLEQHGDDDGDGSRHGPIAGATSNENGQSSVLVMVVVMVLGVGLLSAIVDFGGITQDRAKAQTAADAAALASVVGGRAAALEYAEANGAVLVSWTPGPGPHEVTVTVRLGDSQASARASNGP